MANTYKDIVITPYRGDATNDPVIKFSAGDSSSNADMNVRFYATSSGTLSFEGTAGQLFSITNDLTNSIFSVNDVSGIPSIDVYANGNIYLASFGGNTSIRGNTLYVDTAGKVGVGTTTTNETLTVLGSISATSFANVAGMNVVPAIQASYGQANAGLSQANTARDQANAAYTQANTVFGQANAAYAQANLVYGQANAAYAKANAALPNTSGVTFAGDLTISGNLAINNGLTTVDSITFDTTYAAPFPTSNGRFSWNDTDRTVDLVVDYINGTILQIGQEQYVRVKNQSGQTIYNGNAVMHLGTVGASGILLGRRAVANGYFDSRFVLGMATQDIPNGEDGFVTTFGKVRGLNTTMFSEGDLIYVDPANPGSLINVAPTAPNNKTILATVVTKHSNSGEYFVRPVYGSSLLDDEHGEFTNIANRDIIQWITANNRFENTSESAFLLGVNTQANTARDQANSAFTQANLVFDQANVAFTQSNTVFGQANGAYSQANAAFTQANTVFAQANAAFSQANLVYGQANTAFSQANLVYGQANTARDQANAAFTQANLVYGQANAAYAQANLVYGQANTARNQANNAYSQANLVFGSANSGWSQANLAYAQANTARDQANAGYTQANAAYTKANTVDTVWAEANLAYAQANAAYDQANNAYLAANDKLSLSGGTIVGNLTINGNLSFSGNAVTFNTQSIETDDPLLYLAANNYVSDIMDIGFIANYVNATGQNVHTGLYREHEDKMYYLFQGYDQEPVNNHIGAFSNNMTLAVLNAHLITSNLVLGGTNAIPWIASSYTQANTARDQGNSAFTQANLVFGVANTGWAQANVAYTQANAAYTKANSTTFTSNVVISVTDNANAGLRITQLGTGNAILVEDDTNPDSSPFVVSATGNVGIGVTIPTVSLHVAGSMLVAQNNASQLDVIGEIAEFAHNANSYAQIHVRNANTGTLASGDVVVTADVGTDTFEYVDLGINNSGFNDPSWTINGARDGYLVASNGNFALGVANVGKSLVFFTGGMLAANERMRADPTGNILIGRTTSTVGSGVKLDVAGAINASSLLINGVDTIAASYGQANTSRDQANTARDQANAAYTVANTGWAQGNAAFSQANTVFAQANTARDHANNAYAKANSANVLASVASIEYVIDGGGTAITNGQKGHIEVPFACTLNQWTLLLDQTGSISIQIWKDSYANFPPTVADDINTTPYAITSGVKNQGTIFAVSSTINAGDILAYNVVSASTATRATLSLKVTKT